MNSKTPGNARSRSDLPLPVQLECSLGFSTITSETQESKLVVQGRLPEWLSGTLLRVAPSKFEAGDQHYDHWFDGLAMLHRFEFSGDCVTYANRFLQSASYTESLAQNRIVRGEFATDPCRTLFGRISSLFFPKLTDNCNVNVGMYGDDVVAMTETRLPIRFDPETLETLGVFPMDDRISGVVSTAHPHSDARRGVAYNYLLEFGRKSKYRLFEVDHLSGRQRTLTSIPVARPAYMHSFAMTENHLVLTEFPLVVNPLRLMFGIAPFIRNYRWQPERGVRFHVIEKDSGRVVRQMNGPAFFAFHHVNAFEAGDDVLIDIVVHEDSSVIDQLYLNRLRTSGLAKLTGTLTRFRLPPEGRITRTPLATSGIELPRFDYQRRSGRDYRYVYGAGQTQPGDFLNKITKIDLTDGSATVWHEEGCYPGEPVFVEAPDRNGEDQGVLLSVVLDAENQRSYLLLLDAATMQELARAETPHRITFGFHGQYYR